MTTRTARKTRLKKPPARQYFDDEEPEQEYGWWDDYHSEMKDVCRHCGTEHPFEACLVLAVNLTNAGSWGGGDWDKTEWRP